MALAPFRRERAVKEILLVKALPLRVVLLYRTAGWNARLFGKSLCKRLCKSLKTLSSAGGRPFRRSSGAPWFLPSAEGERFRRSGGLPPQARFTLKVSVHSGRLRRPGNAVPTAGGAAVWRRRQEGAKTPSGFLIPLLTPPHLPSAATPFGCAAKREGPTGAFGAPRHNS